jgi:hypothetical protein
LKEKGLWTARKEHKHAKGKKELVATYSYEDAAGNLLFEVCRFRNPDGSKTFSQRRLYPAVGLSGDSGLGNTSALITRGIGTR